jgi:hypothetical protein
VNCSKAIKPDIILQERPMKTLTFISAIILYSITASAQNNPDKLTYGIITNSVYSNPYFGFSIKIPRIWYIQDSKAVREITETGKNPEPKTMIDASDETMVNLIIAFKNSRSSSGLFNPNIACMAEKINKENNVKYGIDYLKNIKDLMTMSHGNMKYTFTNNTAEKVDGITFDTLIAETAVRDIHITQKFYASIIKGYVFTIVLSSSNEEDKNKLNEILSSAQFDKNIFAKKKNENQKSTAVPAATDAPKK